MKQAHVSEQPDNPAIISQSRPIISLRISFASAACCVCCSSGWILHEPQQRARLGHGVPEANLGRQCAVPLRVRCCCRLCYCCRATAYCFDVGTMPTENATAQRTSEHQNRAALSQTGGQPARQPDTSGTSGTRPQDLEIKSPSVLCGLRSFTHLSRAMAGS